MESFYTQGHEVPWVGEPVRHRDPMVDSEGTFKRHRPFG